MARAGRRPLTPAIEAYVRGFGRPGDRGVVAEVGGVPAGAAWYRLMGRDGYGFAAPDIPELAIAVVPHARGAGVGSELLARLVTASDAEGVGGLSLSVEPGNPARRLYERHGFLRTGERGGAWTMVRLAPTSVRVAPWGRGQSTG